jgi:hypothetical protein
MLHTFVGSEADAANYLEQCQAEALEPLEPGYPYELTRVYNHLLRGQLAVACSILEAWQENPKYSGPLEILAFPPLASESGPLSLLIHEPQSPITPFV